MLLVALIWGANFSVTKLALRQIPPLGFTAIRFGVASVLMLWILRHQEGKASLPPGSLPKLIWLGVVGNSLYQLGFILGLARTSATNSALLLATMPTMVVVLGGVLGIERTTARMRWGTAIATLGVVLVVAARGVGFSMQTLRGDLLIMAGVVAWSVYTLGLRTLPEGISPLRVTTLTLITGTPGLLLAGLPDLLSMRWASIEPGAWGALAYATLLSLVVAYLLWNTSVRSVGGSRTAIYMCVAPLVAGVVAWVLLGERPVPLQAAGAIFIVGGVLLTRPPQSAPDRRPAAGGGP